LKRFLAGVLTLFVAGCVGGKMETAPSSRHLPPAPVPDYAVGDEFLFSVDPIEDLHKAVSVDAKSVTFESRIFGTITQPKAFSNPVTWTGGGFAASYQVWLERDLSGLFPLEVGKAVSSRGTGNFGGNQLAVTFGCTVLRQESITVRAGTFDAFVVDCQMSHDRGGFRTIYWYSPDVGHFVGADRGGRFHELVRFTRVPL